MKQSHFVIGFVAGCAGYMLLSRTLGPTVGDAFVAAIVVVSGFALVAAWRSCGALLVTLGHPIRKSQTAGALALLAFFAWIAYDDYTTSAEAAAHWLRVPTFLLVVVLLLVQAGRGLSVREHGILAMEGFIPWDRLDWWKCDDAESALTIQVRGTSFLDAFRLALPPSYRSLTWALDARRLASARTTLREKAPNREAES